MGGFRRTRPGQGRNAILRTEGFDPREYWEKRLTDNWGLHGAGFLSYGRYYNKWLYRVRRRVFQRIVRSLDLNPEGANVLDIGSGTGFYVDLWRSLAAKSITASDMTDVAVQRLKESHPDCRVVSLDISRPLEGQPLSGPRFDVITAFAVLFHIVDDRAFRSALFNISSLCASGGYFIFSENFPHRGRVEERHQVSRPLQEITALLQEAEFRIIQRVPMFYLMNAPVDARGRWAIILWHALMLPVRLVKPLGALYGALLFPLETFLTGALRESPTTEVMICRRR